MPTRPAVESSSKVRRRKLGEEILFATRIITPATCRCGISRWSISTRWPRPVEAAEKYTLEENGPHSPLAHRLTEIGRSIQLGVAGVYRTARSPAGPRDDGRRAEPHAQASVEIVAEASLEVTIAELNDPIRVGAEGQYMINVKNTAVRCSRSGRRVGCRQCRCKPSAPAAPTTSPIG